MLIVGFEGKENKGGRIGLHCRPERLYRNEDKTTLIIINVVLASFV